jgi:hypothetical protein
LGLLRRAQSDGHYYTIAFRGHFATYQIAANGVNYLRDKGVRENIGNVRPHLDYLLKRKWAWDTGKGSANSELMTDFAWRLAESELGDRPPLVGIPRFCVRKDGQGTHKLVLMVPALPRDRLGQLTQSQIDQLHDKNCRFSVASKTTYEAATIYREPYPVEITPNYHQPVAVKPWGNWPKGVHWPELFVPLDGLTDYELFALPEDGGRRLLRPQLAPGDSLLLLERPQPAGHALWSIDLRTFRCEIETIAKIGVWTVHRVTMPDVPGGYFSKALEIIDARPAPATWDLRTLGVSFFDIDSEGRPMYSVPGKIVLSCSATVPGEVTGGVSMATFKIFKDATLERTFDISIKHGKDLLFDLPLYERGIYTLVVGSKELGWARTALRVASESPVKRPDDRYLVVTLSAGSYHPRLSGIDNDTCDIELNREHLSGVSLEIKRWRRDLRLSISPAAPGSRETLAPGEQPSDRFHSVLRELLISGRSIAVQVTDDATAQVTINITPKRTLSRVSNSRSAKR